MPADLPEEPTSVWGQVKKIAHYSPIVHDIGDQFAEDVDPNSARDRKALAGTYGPLDTLKSFLAGAGGGFMDTVRNTATPAGLASLVPAEGTATRVAAGAGGALFGAEGAETLMNDQASAQDKALGLANIVFGLHGVHNAMGPREAMPAAREIPKPERFAPNTSAASHVPNPEDAALPFTTGVEPHLPNTSAAPSDAALPFDDGLVPAPLRDVDRYMPNTSAAPMPAEQGIPVSEPPPAVSEGVTSDPTKPRLAAPEVAAMLSGRAKFSAANPDLSLPPGASDELDRMGVEYSRTQAELKRLLGMPDADPVETARMQQGARELGSRLRKTAKGFTTPPPEPPPAMGDVSPAPEPPAPPAPAQAQPQSLAEMLQAAIASQEADRAARVASQPPPAPGREGHFRLPEARVSDDVYEKIRAHKGIAPTPEERLDRGQAPGGGEPVRPAAADAFSAEYPLNTESVADFANDETGAADPKLLANLLRVPAGAAIGAYFDPEDRTRGAVLGGGLGAATMVPGLAEKAERARYFSMLSGPAQIKNIAGDIGVVGHAAAERALTHGPGEGLNVLKEFFSPATVKNYKDIFSGAEVPLDRMDQPHSTSDKGLFGLPFRAMGAADEATQQALSRAGVDHASERTFTAEPQSKIGQSAMAFQRQGGPLARLILPFAKTAINQAEAGILPLQQLLHLDELSPEARRQVLAKAGLLAGYGAAGAAYGSSDFADEHPLLSPFAAVAAGPGALEFAVAQQFKHALHTGKSSPEALNQAATELRQQMPTPSEWAFNPSSILASLVPTGLRAVNPDDTERDTSHSLFGPLLSRIPFLSRLLPAKGSAHVSHKFSDE